LSGEEPVPAPPSTVLVVEDEIMVRAVVAAYLRDCGFDVVEAANADEGVRVLEAGVRVDIVFSDVNMPGSMDGFGLAQWLRQERPGLKIVLTSGGLWTAREMSDLCEDGPLLAKPYDHARLARQLRELLTR
jgi:CheY-like chemotaxis protein